jgi:fido (protein-threonine AMPylation protein)
VAVDGPDPTGTTPLDEEERRQLKPAHITTRSELNEWEQANISEAFDWAFSSRRGRRPRLLSDTYVRRLHKRMLGKTWKWAGEYRTTERNIGIAPWQIGEQVRIHPFPNGNGRHARLMTDVLLRSLGREPFSWGGGNLETAGDARTRYLEALRAADRGEFDLLVRFVRS